MSLARRISLAIMAAAAVLLVTIAPPVAEAATYYYESDEGYSASSYQTEYGTRDADGACVVGGPTFPESDADTVSWGAEEVEYDPDTCRTVYRCGPLQEGWENTPPESGGRLSDEGSGEEPGLEESAPPPQCRPWLPCPSSSTYSQRGVSELQRGVSGLASSSGEARRWYPRKELYGAIWYEDPIHIDVSKTEVWLNFKSTNTCAAAGRYKWRWHENWLDESGWQRDRHEFSKSTSCSLVSIADRASFKNDEFCKRIGLPFIPTSTTRTYIWPNGVTGLRSGRHHPFRSYRKLGGCSWALSSEVRYKVRRLD